MCLSLFSANGGVDDAVFFVADAAAATTSSFFVVVWFLSWSLWGRVVVGYFGCGCVVVAVLGVLQSVVLLLPFSCDIMLFQETNGACC